VGHSNASTREAWSASSARKSEEASTVGGGVKPAVLYVATVNFLFLVLPKHPTRTDHGTAVGVRGQRDGFVRSQRGAREAHARGGARRAPPRAGARWPAEDAATRIAAPGGESGCDRHPLLNPGWPAGGASRGLASAPPTDRDATDSVVMGASSPPSRPRLMQRTRRGRRVRCVKGATSRRPKTAKPFVRAGGFASRRREI